MDNNVNEEVDINQLMKVRREKLEELRNEGKDPFAVTKYDRTETAGQIKANYDEYEEKDVSVAGRIIAKRIMGKASFCTIQDSDEKIQSYVSINDLGEESYKAFKTYDIGDFIGIKGFVFKTRTGEISVHAKEVTLLSKSFKLISLKSSIFIKQNLDAFHNLLIKFHVDFIFSSSYLKSIPGAVFVVKKNLSESAPYISITSIGSIPLPRLLLIFLPFLSLIRP